MPSALGHIASAGSLAYTLGEKRNGALYWCVVLLLAVFPDFDVLSFKLGIPYAHPLGHRGFFHSIAFMVLTAGLFSSCIPALRAFESNRFRLFITLSLVGLTHPLLDAMTSGGLGVGLLMPLDMRRFFLPWRPIKVSPIGVREFLGLWGFRVLKSELAWIVLPSMLLTASAFAIRRSIDLFRNGFASRARTVPSQEYGSSSRIERKGP